MSSTRTQQPHDTQPPAHEDGAEQGRTRRRIHPAVWVSAALVATTGVAIAGVLVVNNPEPEAVTQLPTTPPIDSAAQQEAAQAAYQEYVAAETAAYEARDVGPLIGLASSDVVDPLRSEFADLRAGDFTASGEVTATTDVTDYAVDSPDEGWLSVTLDVCTDTSAFSLTFPDGTDARTDPDGGSDYLTQAKSTVTMVRNEGTGAERWIVQDIQRDNATPCG